MANIKFFVISMLLLCCGSVLGQSDLRIGEWKSHLAYLEGTVVTQNKNQVIYAASRGVFTLDKTDLSVKFLSTENGLSDATVSKLGFDHQENQLFIVYADNNIDILKDGEIINFPFVQKSTTIIGSKNINDIYFDNAGFTYFAADFGLLVFNNKKLEFPTTTFTENIRINTVAINQGQLYAGTNAGLYKVSLDKSLNIADFSVWSRVKVANEPISVEIKHIESKFNNLYVATELEKVWRSNGASDNFETLFTASSNEVINYISGEGTNLMIGVQNQNNSSKTLFVDDKHNIVTGGTDCINRTVYAIEDEQKRIWYADQWEPIRYTETKTSGCQKIKFSGPSGNSAGEISFKDNIAYITSLGITEDYQYPYTNRGVYIYNKGKWTNFNQDNLSGFKDFDMINVQGIAVSPKSPEILIGSYWNGVMSLNPDTKVVKHWNKNNSTLQGITGDEARTRVPYVLFDDKENLWVSNFGAPKPLAVKTKDDKWYSFSVPCPPNLGDISIDQAGNKWFAVVGTGNGLLVYNEGADLASTSDDKVRYISKNNSEITGNKVNCLVVDLDGSVWVGTDAGPVVFDCGDPFKSECKGNTRKVIVDNIPAPLLKAEDILCIEVDGANQKWFGTRNGIFVQSPDGSDEVAKYNSSNSPLLDNKVTNLKFNPISGEMFVITNQGIQSLKTETVSGGSTHGSNVYSFPNPVRPDYNGPIAIKGLVRDANVKITDINGQLIYETNALGGQAIWDGRDYKGVKAAAGVYLVFSASEDISRDPDNLVTKILVIR